MASGPTLPPQAYTREILTAAFNWLQSQPESVKKLATTPDSLVGIFMRAQRFGNSSMEADAPVSSQNFMSDLKNLAEDLKQFEVPRARRQPAASSPPVANMVSNTSPTAPQMNSHLASQIAQHIAAATTAATSQSHSTSSTLTTTPVPTLQESVRTELPRDFFQASDNLPATHSVTIETTGSLNSSSRAMIHEVKTGLNLSSDAEAINLMVALAYKKLKNLLA
jgi:hypothetical protein